MGRDTYLDQTYYEAASITVATGQTNRDIRANNPTLWRDLQQSTCMIVSTDQTITIRLNDTSYWPIVMTSSESPKRFDYIRVSNMFVTNSSGSTANMKVELYQ